MNQAAASSTAMIVGSFTDADVINQKLALAAERYHLVSPATTCPRLRSGCLVGLNVVPIAPETETHDVGFGKRSLLRTALLKLANAAGICWNTRASGRMDSGIHPFFCHWHSEGGWQSLDGTWLPVSGDAQLDLRDGSAAVAKILESAQTPEKGRIQLRDTRSKILEHAQSKSELRAIRKALAIRTYTIAELAKPFVVARLMWVGDPNDPEDRKAIREHFLQGSAAMFGESSPPRALTPTASKTYALPPVDMIGEVVTEDGEILDHPATPEPPPVAPPRTRKSDPPPPPAAQAPATPAQPRRAAPTEAARVPSPGEVTAPYGRQKGELISALTDENLQWMGDSVRDALNDPAKARYRANNERLLAAVEVEEERRNGGTGAPLQQAGEGDDQIPF